MTLYAALLLFGILALGMWLIYRYVPEPIKTIGLWIVGVAIVIFLLSVMGVIPWMKSVRI